MKTRFALIALFVFSNYCLAAEDISDFILSKTVANERLDKLVALECANGTFTLEMADRWRSEGDRWITYTDRLDFWDKIRKQADQISPSLSLLLLGAEPGRFSNPNVRQLRDGSFSARSFGLPEIIRGCKTRVLSVSGYLYSGNQKEVFLDRPLFDKLSIADQYVARLAMNNTNMEVVRFIFNSNSLQLSFKERYKLHRKFNIPTLGYPIGELLLDPARLVAHNGEPVLATDLRLIEGNYYLIRTGFYPGGRVREYSWGLESHSEYDGVSAEYFSTLSFYRNSVTPSSNDMISCPTNVTYRANGQLLLCGTQFYNRAGQPINDKDETKWGIYTNPKSYTLAPEFYANKQSLILGYDVIGGDIVIEAAPKLISELKIIDSDGCGGANGISHSSHNNSDGTHQITITMPKYCTALAEITWGDKPQIPKWDAKIDKSPRPKSRTKN